MKTDPSQLQPNQLLLDRPYGRELFEIDQVSVYVGRPRPGQAGGLLLNLEFRASKCVECSVPQNQLPLLDPTPVAEVWLPVASLVPSDLVGTTSVVKETYNAERDARNRMYYCEHDPLWDIEARFVEHSGARCRVELTGSATDVSHWAGNGPEMRVSINAWFESKS